MYPSCVCSNPRCNTTFRRPGEGRIFFFPAGSASEGRGAAGTDESNWIGHWLCSRCERWMTVIMTDSGVRIQLRRLGQGGAVPSYVVAEDPNHLQSQPALHG